MNTVQPWRGFKVLAHLASTTYRRCTIHPARGSFEWPGKVLHDARENQRSLHADHIAAAARWLAGAQDATGDGGFPGDYHLMRGWSASYPETTGYLVPTLLALASESGLAHFEDRAARAIGFLMQCQLDNGAFPGGRMGDHNRAPSIFNTGQIVCGLTAWHAHSGDQIALDSAVRAADWMVSAQDPSGGWSKFVYLNVSASYLAHASCWLAELGNHIGVQRYCAAARRHVGHILELVDAETGWVDNCGFTSQQHARRIGSTHTIAYTLAGILRTSQLLGMMDGVDAVANAATHIADVINSAGWLPGVLDWRWQRRSRYSCVTGAVQMALVWFELASVRAGDSRRLSCAAVRAIHAATQAQEMYSSETGRYGGVPGSDPIWGGYAPLAYPNWAAKFFIDALLAYRALLQHGALSDGGSPSTPVART